MLTTQTVINYIRNTRIDEGLEFGESIDDLAFVGLEMAMELARFKNRGETIEDLTLAFKWICKIAIPGAPPKPRRAKEVVADVIKGSKERGENPFVIRPEMLKETPSPLGLVVKAEVVQRMGIPLSRSQVKEFNILGRRLEGVQVREIMGYLQPAGSGV